MCFQCGFNVVSMWFQCVFNVCFNVSNVFSMCFRCVFNVVVSMCFQCVFSVFSMCFQCGFNVFSMCFQCVLNVFSMCFQCVFNVFSMCFQCVSNFFSMCFQCVLNVFSMCSQCVFNVFSMCFKQVAPSRQSQAIVGQQFQAGSSKQAIPSRLLVLSGAAGHHRHRAGRRKERSELVSGDAWVVSGPDSPIQNKRTAHPGRRGPALVRTTTTTATTHNHPPRRLRVLTNGHSGLHCVFMEQTCLWLF
jgi:hypothetical protein